MSCETLNCEILNFVARKLDNNAPKCGEKCKQDTCPYVNSDLFFPKTRIEELHEEIEVGEEEILERRNGGYPVLNWIKFLESGRRY